MLRCSNLHNLHALRRAVKHLSLCSRVLSSVPSTSSNVENRNNKSNSNDTSAFSSSTATNFKHQQGLPKYDRGPFGWRSLALVMGVGTAGLIYYAREKQKRMQDIMTVKSIGKAAVGGPFALLDKNGATFTEKDLLGRWTLIYFGFTLCPDVCPEELTKIAEALDILRRRGKTVGSTSKFDISPILISVDPERDTPARTHEYAVGFHEAFTGLSGTKEKIQEAAKAYRVYFSKSEKTSPDDYLVDHSIITYLMDPNGEFVDFYAKNVSATEMAAKIETKMLSWRP